MLNDIAPYCAVALIMLWAISAELNYRERVEEEDPEWRKIVHEKNRTK